MNISHHSNLDPSLELSKELLLGMVSLNDPYTANHCEEVALFACTIGRHIGLIEKRVNNLYYAALLHDIGKQAIPKTILSKPGKLTSAEYSLVQTHVEHAVDLLERVNFNADIVQAISEHHERLDGSGYPKGMKGDKISIEGQILGIVDVISALTSKRSYRMPMLLDDALAMIQGQSPEKFSTDLITAASDSLHQVTTNLVYAE